jgi:hypothetical protein
MPQASRLQVSFLSQGEGWLIPHVKIKPDGSGVSPLPFFCGGIR